MTLNELERRALELSTAERELLATRLLTSVDNPDCFQLEDGLLDVLQRRLAELVADPSSGVPARQVHDEVKRKHGWN